MKRWVCLVLAGVLLLSMSACEKISDLSIQGSTNNESPAETFALILKNKQSFYSVERQMVVFLSDYKKNIWQYSSVDMDCDNDPEFAIMFEDGDILVLRKDGTSLFGFHFGLHSMYQINLDGSFLWNSDSGNIYGCSTLAFEGGRCKTVELWRVENNMSGSTEYYVNEKTVSKEEFQSVSSRGNEKSISWNPWTALS